MTISLFEFYYLAPILVLGCAIIVLLFLLLLLRVSTKTCAMFTAISLSLALLATVLLGYQIVSSKDSTLFSSDNLANVSVVGDGQGQLQSHTVVVNTSHVPNATDTPSINTSNDAESVAIQSEQLASPDNSILNVEEAHIWQATYVTALFTCDGYGLLYAGLVLLICIVVAALAYQWFKYDSSDQGLFYLILLFSALGGVILVYASHLISLFIGIELLSIPLVGLIGFQYSQTNSIEAAIKYMILSAVATSFLLLGIAFYYAATGELTFSGLSFQLSMLESPSLLLLTGICLMIIGIGFKLSLVPFQLWLPDVYQGAPTAVSLLLTTVGKIAVFCAVARLFLLAPIVNNDTIKLILVLMAFFSILWGSFFALIQTNIKRLLAYSSITNVGYLFIALIAVQYQVLALETIGIYLVSYVLANICIFGVISLESSSLQHRDSENEMDLCGLFWRRPIMALAMGMGLLSLAGIPLTIGFMSRFSLILLSVTAELWWLAGAIVIGSAFGLYFYLRLVINLYLRYECIESSTTNPETSSPFSLKKLGLSETIIACSALLIVFLGVYPQPLFTLISLAKYLTN